MSSENVAQHKGPCKEMAAAREKAEFDAAAAKTKGTC